MLHHYITKYIDENGNYIVEAWLQFNFFKWCFCFSRRKKVIKNNSTITLQVANMDDELITSIDTDGKDSVGITQDGYKVFVNGKLLGIENSSINEWVSIENYFSKLLLVDLSGFERMYLFPFDEIEPLYPLILPCFAWL